MEAQPTCVRQQLKTECNLNLVSEVIAHIVKGIRAVTIQARKSEAGGSEVEDVLDGETAFIIPVFDGFEFVVECRIFVRILQVTDADVCQENKFRFEDVGIE